MMKLFAILSLLVSTSGFADDLTELTKRVEKLEKKISEQRWSCSIQCIIYSYPEETYHWGTVKVASGEDAGSAFMETLKQCDEYFAEIKRTSGYQHYAGRYDNDKNASVKRNCVSNFAL